MDVVRRNGCGQKKECLVEVECFSQVDLFQNESLRRLMREQHWPSRQRALK